MSLILFRAGSQEDTRHRAPRHSACAYIQYVLNNARVPASSAHHVARGRKTLQMHGFLYKHMGKLQRAITLIVRCESKICLIKSLVSTHSACPCKNYPPQCSQTPHELDYLFKFAFFKETRTLSRKNCPKTTIYSSWVHSGTIQCKQAA